MKANGKDRIANGKRYESKRKRQDSERKGQEKEADQMKEIRLHGRGGLGGADISLKDILGTIERLEAVKDEPGEKEVMWYMEED